ncbi:hypothetical protein M670_02248 [Schinkia azotoformans MEV2011]|uniref:DUF881 domain-containing protein n=2 Tax=Schinkia azotoformans TaxID=1454 RepID=K6DP35_SCHAZ|nr:DUF881 domain-containing protein [Schinkia azotoformans]EKN62531.1 hypothetical protein BAZO_20933 [Schinkia azotoformans LMG 9581]KEF38620.1 hypothetical protein M670_02248 [Schinkia azotoformans MEV2011]MEC1640866.1 DUF881 domain-containing protein [Schinkia azotoformans]MEC1698066.1 DUF881 domain-containing protein [Schinkia azotoformans]MEC1715388.1 DUF881 domain-containing protein [Schinkia azotoformans]
MRSKSKVTLALITTILGFMMAIQFQTIKEPVVRDTRDIWEIREDIEHEQRLITELYKEIRTKEDTLRKYEEAPYNSKYEGITEQLEELKKKIGLTEQKGSGILIKISPSFNQSMIGEPYQTVPPDLLIRLINELYRYKALAVSVDDERIIVTSPIRDVNGKTYINNTPLGPLPIEIKVIAENAEKLHNQMQVSQIVDEFFALENLELTSTLQQEVTLPAYDEVLRNKYMQPVEPVNLEKGNS